MLTLTRRQRLIDLMADHGLDALSMYGNPWQMDYLRYVSDFGIIEGQAVAILSRDNTLTLYVDMPGEAARAALECADVVVKYERRLVHAVSEALGNLRTAKIGYAPANIFPNFLLTSDAATRMQDCTLLVDQLLMHKVEQELDATRRAALVADQGYDVFLNAARPGRKDYELIAELEAFFRSRGVPDNFMLIGSGGPEVKGMTPPVGKTLKAGDLVTTELTPRVDGYYAQICRTMVIGDASAAQQNAFSVYLEAMEAGIEAARPGATAADVARAENDIFRREGLGDYVTSKFTRVRGHGIGLFPDSKPHILENVDVPLKPGMAIMVHPNTYFPDVGYMVLGDAVIVTEGAPEVLTRTPRRLFATSAQGGTSA